MERIPLFRPAIVEELRLADGRRLALRRWPGCGPALVLLHGLLDSPDSWQAVADRCRQRCVALALPGFGASDPPREATVASYADDVASAVERLGLEDCVFAGHSFGAGVAAVAAARCPQARALALLAPVGFHRLRLAEAAAGALGRDHLARLLMRSLDSALIVRAGHAVLVGRGRPAGGEPVERLHAGVRAGAPGARSALRALSASTRAPAAAAFTGPAVAVFGTRDRLAPPAHARAVRAVLPGARLEVWPGMGHLPHRERPDAVARLLGELTGRAPAREAGAGTEAADRERSPL